MCGRYDISHEDTNLEILKIIEEANNRLTDKKVKVGEIFPTDLAPVIIGKEKIPYSIPLSWGYPKMDGKGVIINARSETLLSKSLFAQSFETKRLVVPSTGFYEWSHGTTDKIKYKFNKKDSSVTYMTGLYRRFDEGYRFVIITTEANDSIKDIHIRMPLILDRDNINNWLFDEDYAADFISKIPPYLEKMALV